jgi:peptide/nickel transport system permease protein
MVRPMDRRAHPTHHRGEYYLALPTHLDYYRDVLLSQHLGDDDRDYAAVDLHRGIKVYRAIFLQIKESPYIEAARAYGASDLRIIVRYMAPRIIPILVPGFVTLIPGLVFLEASLGLLGLGDPVLPTWGKILNDAQSNGALYKGYYYWVLSPSVLLMFTALGFSLLGFALDRIFNPRLREL